MVYFNYASASHTNNKLSGLELTQVDYFMYFRRLYVVRESSIRVFYLAPDVTLQSISPFISYEDNWVF
jgi:hypothetical protein